MKKAILATFRFTTRVIVDESTDIEYEIIKVAKPKIEKKVKVEFDENLESWCEDLEMPYNPLTDNGWIETNSNPKTLQFGRYIDKTTWEYMEWLDENISMADKLKNLEDSNWRKETINLMDYPFKFIQEVVEYYGHTITEVFNNFKIFRLDDMTLPKSMQVACRCIFEHNRYLK